MAITKYKVIQKNLEAVINYAKNGDKTEKGILVSGINCLPDTAYFQTVRFSPEYARTAFSGICRCQNQSSKLYPLSLRFLHIAFLHNFFNFIISRLRLIVLIKQTGIRGIPRLLILFYGR